MRRTMHGGYGMGLVVTTESELGDLVYHYGGLPGYASNMVWHPDAQVAVVSMANVTYAPLVRANLEALDILRGSGCLTVAPAVVSAVATERLTALVGLFNTWSDEAAARIFADNVELDEPFARRAQAIRDLVGPRAPLTLRTMHAVNNAETNGVLADRNGHPAFEVWCSASPEVPPRIQAYTLGAMEGDARF